VLTAALSIVAQLYASFYLGWFLLLGLAVLAGIAVVGRATRHDLLAVARRNGYGILLACAVSLVALIPFLAHYGRAAAELPPHRYDHTMLMIPTVESWVTMGPRSWAYGWLERPDMLALLRRSFPDVPIGFGLLTAVCATLGLFQAARTHRWMAAVLIATALLVLVTLRLPGNVTAWKLLWLYLPSASAVRAVFRIGVVVLLPAALGLAFFLEGQRRRWLAVLLAAACVAEQGTTMVTYSKRQARQRAEWIAQRVGPGCRSFFFLADREGQDALPPLFYHVDAMEAQAQRALPTINGYTGQFPPGYGLYEIVVRLPEHRQIVHDQLRQWISRERLDPAGICVVEEPFPFF